MNQPEQPNKIHDAAQEVSGQHREPGQLNPIILLLMVIGFGPSVVGVLGIILLEPMFDPEIGLIEWCVRLLLCSGVGLTLLYLLVYAGYISITKRTLRLEPDGLKIIRRPLPVGQLEFFERSQIVGAEVGVPVTVKKSNVCAVLLVLATGERRVLLFTHTREEATSLTWEVTDYYGLPPTIRHVAGVHASDCWYPIVNGQIDLSGVEPWPQEKVVKESKAPWCVDLSDNHLRVRACPWYRDYFQAAAAIMLLVFALLVWFDEDGSSACAGTLLVIATFFSLFFAVLRRNTRTTITADAVSTKNGCWEIGLVRTCRPADIQRIRFLPSLVATDLTGRAEVFLSMTSRADTQDIHYTARGFKSSGQMAGLARLIASRLPVGVPIGPEGVVPGPGQTESIAKKTDDLQTQPEARPQNQPMASPDLPEPARPVLEFRSALLKRRWPTIILYVFPAVLISTPFFMLAHYNHLEPADSRLSDRAVVILWVIGLTLLLSGVLPGFWLLIRRSRFVIKAGQFAHEVLPPLGLRKQNPQDAAQVQELWLLAAPGMNPLFQWPGRLCIKAAGRYRLVSLGYWETVATAHRAMRQVRQALGIQPNDQETIFAVIHRGVAIGRDAFNRHEVPENPGFEPTEKTTTSYKKTGEHGWRRISLTSKGFIGIMTMAVLALIGMISHDFMSSHDARWINRDLFPLTVVFTVIVTLVYLFKIISAVEYESVQAAPLTTTRLSTVMLKFASHKFSSEELQRAKVYMDHRFTATLGCYETWFQIAVPDELTNEPRVVLDKIAGYEEACEILGGLKAGARPVEPI